MKKKFFIFAIIFLMLPGIVYLSNSLNSIQRIVLLFKSSYNECCKVKRIEIRHDNLVDENYISKIINVKTGDSIFTHSTFEIRKLLEADSRIDRAEVSLSLSGIFNIDVKSKIPKAILWDKGAQWFIDINGDKIRKLTSNDNSQHYIIIFGNNAANQINQLLMLTEEFKVYKKIISANFIGNRRWDLYLIDKTVIRLPEDHIEKAFQATVKLLKMPITEKKISIIDLRLMPNKIYMRLS